MPSSHWRAASSPQLQPQGGYEGLEGAVSRRPPHAALPFLFREIEDGRGQVGIRVDGLGVVDNRPGPPGRSYPPPVGVTQPRIHLVEGSLWQVGQHPRRRQAAQGAGVLQEHHVGRGVVPFPPSSVAAVDALPPYFTRIETPVDSPNAFEERMHQRLRAAGSVNRKGAVFPLFRLGWRQGGYGLGCGCGPGWRSGWARPVKSPPGRAPPWVEVSAPPSAAGQRQGQC